MPRRSTHAGGGGVVVAWARVAAGAQPDQLLDGVELARARAFVRRCDRQRYVAARALLRLLVSDATGVQPDRVRLTALCATCGRTDHGRPLLRDDPSVGLSLSRSHERVVVALGRLGEPIGVDVQAEAAIGFAGFDEIAASPAERGRLASLADEERLAARTRIWVGKEAVLKAIGCGLRAPLDGFDVSSAGHTLTELDVGPGYRCCLATSGDVQVGVIDATARLAGWAAQDARATR